MTTTSSISSNFDVSANASGIELLFLRDVENGGPASQDNDVASAFAAFVSAAQHSLHIAVYDFHFQDGTQPYALVVNALRERASAGVDVRVAFDAGAPVDVAENAGAGATASPDRTRAFLKAAFDGSGVQVKSVTDLNGSRLGPRLMHNKYILRDTGTPAAAVWTGSANFTDDSWTFQESNVLRLVSTDLARYYATDFDELWQTGNIDSTGANDDGTVQIGAVSVDVAFSPGEGAAIAGRVAGLISSARKRIKISSMLLSSREVLGALSRALETAQVREFGGVYDSTQMQQTIRNWQGVPRNTPLIPVFEGVAAQLANKVSIPWTPDGKHNFMHNKLVVCDDVVFTGSFNLSHSATMNAENVLFIHDSGIADRYSAYVDQLVAHYTTAPKSS